MRYSIIEKNYKQLYKQCLCVYLHIVFLFCFQVLMPSTCDKNMILQQGESSTLQCKMELIGCVSVLGRGIGKLVFMCELVLAIAILSIRPWISQKLQASITKSSSSAAWKTLVSCPVQFFINSKGVTTSRALNEGKFAIFRSLHLRNGARWGQ